MNNYGYDFGGPMATQTVMGAGKFLLQLPIHRCGIRILIRPDKTGNYEQSVFHRFTDLRLSEPAIPQRHDV